MLPSTLAPLLWYQVQYIYYSQRSFVTAGAGHSAAALARRWRRRPPHPQGDYLVDGMPHRGMRASPETSIASNPYSCSTVAVAEQEASSSIGQRANLTGGKFTPSPPTLRCDFGFPDPCRLQICRQFPSGSLLALCIVKRPCAWTPTGLGRVGG